jgi:hypothetical protein
VFNLFAWVRQQARDAFLAGIEDGAKALAADGEPPADLSERRAGPAASDDRSARGNSAPGSFRRADR